MLVAWVQFGIALLYPLLVKNLHARHEKKKCLVQLAFLCCCLFSSSQLLGDTLTQRRHMVTEVQNRHGEILRLEQNINVSYCGEERKMCDYESGGRRGGDDGREMGMLILSSSQSVLVFAW